MTVYHLLLLQDTHSSALTVHLKDAFEVTCVTSIEDCVARLQAQHQQDIKAIVLDCGHLPEPDFELGERLLMAVAEAGIPVVLLAKDSTLKNKLKAFELGFDDYIGPSVPSEELAARVGRAIYNRIANEQLKSRLELANATAYTAMSDCSDLGSNIQFLLDINRCSNFDELGQILFKTVAHYGLSCSLQLRSMAGVKNMEANGMAKDLESQLLTHMKDAGRYVDFSHRTIINYGQCSLLVRNMPLNDEKKYGAIKDNVFSLVQGVDARIKALDEHQRLVEERETLQKLSVNVQEIITRIDESYQEVMREIANVAEDAADSIQSRLPNLALSEEQENYFEEVSIHLISETAEVFNRGLKVDECFKQLSSEMALAIERVSFVSDNDEPYLEGNVCYVDTSQDTEDDTGVELF
jgi:CheY-like chemotaxis protein